MTKLTNPTVDLKLKHKKLVEIGLAISVALMTMKWKPAYQRDVAVKVWISVPASI